VPRIAGGEAALCGLLARLRVGDVVVVLRLVEVRRHATAQARPSGPNPGGLQQWALDKGQAAAEALARAAVADEVLSCRRTAADMARRFRVSEAMISRLLAARRAGGPAALRRSSAGERHGRCGPDRRRAAARGAGRPAGHHGHVRVGQDLGGQGAGRASDGGGRAPMHRRPTRCVVGPAQRGRRLRPPFPVAVFGGPHADVALDPAMSAALGMLVGTRALACVVDLLDPAAGDRTLNVYILFNGAASRLHQTSVLSRHNPREVRENHPGRHLWADHREPRRAGKHAGPARGCGPARGSAGHFPAIRTVMADAGH